MSVLATILIIKAGANISWFGWAMVADVVIVCAFTNTTILKLK
jgi:hypothetical protein